MATPDQYDELVKTIEICVFHSSPDADKRNKSKKRFNALLLCNRSHNNRWGGKAKIDADINNKKRRKSHTKSDFSICRVGPGLLPPPPKCLLCQNMKQEGETEKRENILFKSINFDISEKQSSTSQHFAPPPHRPPSMYLRVYEL